MERYTRHIDEYPCRIKECDVEDWVYIVLGEYPKGDMCEECPFEAMINRLATFEDYFEKRGEKL